MRRSLATMVGEQVTLPDSLIDANEAVSPGSASAGVTFNADGTYNGAGNGNWLTPPRANAGSDYEVIWESGTGSLTTGTAGTYQSMASGYAFARNRTVVGSVSATGTIRIRRVGSASPADSAAAVFTATVESGA